MATPRPQADRLALFETMLRMRRFEEAVISTAAANPHIGRQHLHIGHEATGAAVAANKRPGDRITTTHRNHGYLIACGADPFRALAEILGRADGLNAGKGGSWHLCDAAAGFLSTSAMVGGSIGLAGGGAFAAKQRADGTIAIAHFGDGTLDEGIAYETMNLASVFELPILFACENNSKAGQRPSSMLAAKRLRDVPAALQIDTMIVDGADADAACKVFGNAMDQIRATGKPAFVEATLERWPGSHQIKPAFPTGVTDLACAWDQSLITGEHAGWIRNHDPVLRFARALVADGTTNREDLFAIDKRVAAAMDDARARAEAAPEPAPSTALEGAFA